MELKEAIEIVKSLARSNPSIGSEGDATYDRQREAFRVFADLERWAEVGRKALLVMKEYSLKKGSFDDRSPLGDGLHRDAMRELVMFAREVEL